MPTTKPTITDEHKEKYAKIMGTPVKSNTPSVSPTPKDQNSRLNALLSSLPRPKGIGDKMFIFTGKKKIIVDGKQREEEKVNTVDPAKLELEKKEKEKKEAEIKKAKEEADKAAAHAQESKKEEKHEEKAPQKEKTQVATSEVKTNDTKKKKKPSKMLLYGIGTFVGLGIWTFIWMVVFGYVNF